MIVLTHVRSEMITAILQEKLKKKENCSWRKSYKFMLSFFSFAIFLRTISTVVENGFQW